MKKLIAAGTLASLAMFALTATEGYAQNSGRGGYDRERNSLTLICWGEGRKPGTGVTTGYAWNSDRRKFVPQTYVHSNTQQFDSEVQVELRGSWGQIHLTGKLIPPIHSGGRDGWWDLENIQFGRDTITARYRMNGLNKPRVTINRRSGRISIDGIEKFRGDCDQGDWRGNRF